MPAVGVGVLCSVCQLGCNLDRRAKLGACVGAAVGVICTCAGKNLLELGVYQVLTGLH